MMMQEWFSEGFPVQVPAGASILDAEMQVPAEAAGLIVLAHAGCRLRLTQRIQNVAEHFIREGFGILVMDLLTEEETEIGKQADIPMDDDAFDAAMLAERLDDSLGWVLDLPEAAGLPLGLFGAGPGAWAALAVAASRPKEVAALAVTGLTGPAQTRILANLRAPTLLITDESQAGGMGSARACLAAISGPKRLECLPGHPKGWEESGYGEKVSRLAGRWFEQYLV